MTLHAVTTPHRSRYHVPKPPDELYGILRKFAKATRDASYRSHGGFHSGDVIRSVIASVTNIKLGDADDISRFLKEHRILKADRDENDPGAVWVFSPEAADELYGKCVEAGTADVKNKTFVEMSERVSDPGPPPTNGNGKSIVAFANGISTPKPHDFSSFDDELLELHEKELRYKLEEMRVELEAVTDEQHRRAERHKAQAELTRIEGEEAQLRRKLQDLEEQKLELKARANGRPSG